jgi:hypothetical protein
LLGLAIFGAPVMADPGDPMEATISLGRDPEPPFCVANPGGSVEITWSIEHSTTPNYVYYKLEDPSRTIILEDETYPGSTGIAITRNWTVPNGMVDGKYWVRVEYWSFEAGNEANAEVTFYVCTGFGTICAEKWEDIDCDGVLTPGIDQPVADWWICLETPFDETYCLQTGPDGRVCWENIALGDYTVYEPMLGDWTPVGPTSVELTLTDGATETVVFLNHRCPSPGEESTWGELKSFFR